MNINKVSKVEYPKGKILDSFSNSNSKASTSKSDIIIPKESKLKNSSNTHVNEVKSRSLKSKKEVKTSGVNSSNSTRKKCSSNTSKSNADTEKKTIQERNHDVGQSDREQSNQTQSPKAQSIPSMKSQSHTQKTKTPKKDSPIHSQKSNVEKNEITKHPKCRKKEVSKDPPLATKKKEPRKREPKASVKKPDNPETSRTTETGKTHVSSEDVEKKKNNNHSYEPRSYTPVHHIRWEGNDKEVSGYNCELCNKDLMCSPHDADDDDDDDDDYGYNEDGYYSDEYENEYEFTPSQVLLPAVDILSCGHAFHSECARHMIPDEQSKDPQCVLCLSMA